MWIADLYLTLTSLLLFPPVHYLKFLLVTEPSKKSGFVKTKRYSGNQEEQVGTAQQTRKSVACLSFSKQDEERLRPGGEHILYEFWNQF